MTVALFRDIDACPVLGNNGFRLAEVACRVLKSMKWVEKSARNFNYADAEIHCA